MGLASSGGVVDRRRLERQRADPVAHAVGQDVAKQPVAKGIQAFDRLVQCR